MSQRAKLTGMNVQVPVHVHVDVDVDMDVDSRVTWKWIEG